MTSPITNIEEREQWRARILRALDELQCDAGGPAPPRPHDDADGDPVALATEG